MGKLCTKCDITKPLSEFTRRKNSPDGLSYWCKLCQSKSHKNWRKAHPKRSRTRLGLPRRRRKSKTTAVQRWHAKHPDSLKASRQKYRARKLGAVGVFTAEEFIALCDLVEGRCVACGEIKPLEADHVIPLTKEGRSDLSNIQPLCKKCNMTKGVDSTDYRSEEVKEWATEVAQLSERRRTLLNPEKET